MSKRFAELSGHTSAHNNSQNHKNYRTDDGQPSARDHGQHDAPRRPGRPAIAHRQSVRESGHPSPPASSSHVLSLSSAISNLLTPVSYDTDGDGVLGPIEQCMKKYDTDGSGSFSAAEVKAIINDLEESKETARNLTKLLALFALGFIGLCGVMLGVVVAGNQPPPPLSKTEQS